MLLAHQTLFDSELVSDLEHARADLAAAAAPAMQRHPATTGWPHESVAGMTLWQ